MPKKIYCGSDEVPKEHRRGTMKECVEKRQIRLYGLFKVDPNLLNPESKKTKIKYYTTTTVFEQISKINGKIDKNERIINFSKKESEIAEAKKEIKELKEERKKFADYFKRVKKGDKIPVEKKKRTVKKTQTKKKSTK